MSIYKLCKQKILSGVYERENMMRKLDTYLLGDRITDAQYAELVALMPSVTE